MPANITDILSSIGELESRMIKNTANAENQCACVSLILHSDGSGRVLFQWTQRLVCSGKQSSSEENLLATIFADEENSQTEEDFDSLQELEEYLRLQKVM